MKPIKLTEAQAVKISEEVLKAAKDMKLYDGKIDLKYAFNSVQADVSVGFSPMAFSKMMALVYNFDSEVAWHGTAVKTEDGYFIEDVMIYPQTVTGSTVNTDQEEYEKWLMGLEDEVFNKVRMQGHSHVNMKTSPSGVDTTHQEAIIDQLGPDDYYIFMIWNKKMEHTILIFDMAENAMYEDSDVRIYIGDRDFSMQEFLDDAEEKVVKKTYTYNSYKKDDKKPKPKKVSTYKKDKDTWEEGYDYSYLRYAGGYDF